MAVLHPLLIALTSLKDAFRVIHFRFMSQKLSTSTLKFLERRAPIQHGSVHGLLNVRRAMRSAGFQGPVWQRWYSNDFRPDSNKSSSEHFYEPWRSTPATPAEYETIIAQPSTPGPQQNPNHFSQKLPAHDMGDMNIAEDHWYWSVKEQQRKERQLISQARELLTSRSRNPEAHPVQRALQDLKARTQLLSEGMWDPDLLYMRVDSHCVQYSSV